MAQLEAAGIAAKEGYDKLEQILNEPGCEIKDLIAAGLLILLGRHGGRIGAWLTECEG